MDFSKTQEFYDLMTVFENTHKHLRLDREKRGDTPAGYWYQSGETNDAFKQYLEGYMAGRAVYLGRADETKADAALGRAVRKMVTHPKPVQLCVWAGRWYVEEFEPCNSDGENGRFNAMHECSEDQPEAALLAAGLMEGEGE